MASEGKEFLQSGYEIMIKWDSSCEFVEIAVSSEVYWILERLKFTRVYIAVFENTLAFVKVIENRRRGKYFCCCCVHEKSMYLTDNFCL